MEQIGNLNTIELLEALSTIKLLDVIHTFTADMKLFDLLLLLRKIIGHKNIIYTLLKQNSNDYQP